MDRRRLKNAPSLLGRISKPVGTSNLRPAISAEADGSEYISSGVRRKSPEINSDESRALSPVLSRGHESRRTNSSSSTQFSHTQTSVHGLKTVQSQRKIQSQSPELEESPQDSEDSDENFLEVSDKRLKSAQKSKLPALKRKRRILVNTSSEDELPSPKKASTQRSAKHEEAPKKQLRGIKATEDVLPSDPEKTRLKTPNSKKKSQPPKEDLSDSELESNNTVADRTKLTSRKSVEQKRSDEKPKASYMKNNLPRRIAKPLLDGDSDSDDMFNAGPKSMDTGRNSTEVSPVKLTVQSTSKKKHTESNVALRKKVLASQKPSENVNKNPKAPHVSPPTRKICENERGTILLHGRDMKSVLEKYLYEAGVMLMDDDANLLCDNQPIIVEKLEKLLASNKYEKNEIITTWQQHIEDENNLQNVLNPTKMANEQEGMITLNEECVARILLHVPNLQTDIALSLLDRLALSILTEESLDDVPWSGLLLRQFRFLEQVVNPASLVEKLGELLESAPKCFQREIILYLPDIILDAQHHTIAEMLCKLMESSADLTAAILDCISNLTLSQDYLEELRDKTIDLLKGNPQFSSIPAITRFILTDCANQDSRKKVLTTLRSIDMQPLAGENLGECFTNQVLIVSALRMAILVSKQMADAAFVVQQNVKKDPKPLDLVMLLLIHSSASTKKKQVESLLKHRIQSGFYRTSLLNSLYYDYKEVGRELQTVAMNLACFLLKSGDRVYANFAIEWFRLLFISQEDAIHKQREILEKIILLMGVGAQTSKNALAVLMKIASKEEEKVHLQKHCHHLRILLEKVDDLNLEEIATLSDLLHGLCASSNTTSDALQDDLDILLHKQLSSVKTLTKCKGVLGAVMAIKHLVAYPRSKERALQLFSQVIAAVKTCSRSRALFYDQMADVIANTKTIDAGSIETFTDHFVGELMQTYLTDLKEYSGNLMVEFGLNTEQEVPEDDVYAVNFGNARDGAAISALFRLVKVCCMRTSDGDLSPIDALLGCPLLLSKNIRDPDSEALDQIFHTINWFRELISGFVHQTDPTTQAKLLKRLENLMTLQSELGMHLMLADSNYQPPICYFHHFPSPPFVKIEKKPTKRGNKTIADKSSLFEWEAWESGSALAAKNPIYFRKLDAKIAHLLDLTMEVRLTQNKTNSITIAQICFIIKELLGMLDSEVSQVFMRDLVGLLPKICSKLELVTGELREKEDGQNRECLRLFLCLLAAIFNWKGFQNAVHSGMLREALRVVASQADEANTMLRSCKELVIQCCGYFESLNDVATRISVAIALLQVFQSVIQHSESLASQYKDKLAKTAYGFLCLDWPDDKNNVPVYRTAVNTILQCWLENELDPLDTVGSILKWLPEESSKLVKPQDCLARILSINRNNFNLLLKGIFGALVKGVKMSLTSKKSDEQTIKDWDSVATSIRSIVQISKSMDLKANWVLFLCRIPGILKLFITSGMPILEHNLKYSPKEVTGIVTKLQEGTKYLHVLCCHTKVSRDTSLAKYVPAAKAVLESLVFSVKGMLVLNNSPEAFWMGNLVNKDLKGQTINAESTEEYSLISTSSLLTDISEELPLVESDESTDCEDT